MAKFNVGDRVRMIERGQYSFDRIGMTGTIVGFVSDNLLEITVDGEDHPIFGNGWTYWVEHENWELLKEESKLRVTSKVEPMCIYSFDSVEDMRTFLKIADQNGFTVVNCEHGIEENGLENKFRVSNKKWVSYGTYGYDTPRFPEYERVQFKVEEEKEVPKCKFKVGDKVKVVRLNSEFDYLDYPGEKNIGMVGTIHELLPKGCTIDCEFEVPLWFHYDTLELVQNEKPKATVLKLGDYKIVFNGDTTVVTDGVGKGVAKRHPDDEYDAVVGLQVAIERFNGGTRKPKIGDKVRVLKVDEGSRYGRHSYSIGDIVTVTGFAHYYANTDICCKDSYGFKQTLTASEYEVLG